MLEVSRCWRPRLLTHTPQIAGSCRASPRFASRTRRSRPWHRAARNAPSRSPLGFTTPPALQAEQLGTISAEHCIRFFFAEWPAIAIKPTASRRFLSFSIACVGITRAPRPLRLLRSLKGKTTALFEAPLSNCISTKEAVASCGELSAHKARVRSRNLRAALDDSRCGGSVSP